MPPILSKDSANRAKSKINLFIFFSEMPPILSKDSANRAKSKINLFIFFSEMPPILFKDSANRAKSKINLFIFFFNQSRTFQPFFSHQIMHGRCGVNAVLFSKFLLSANFPERATKGVQSMNLTFLFSCFTSLSNFSYCLPHSSMLMSLLLSLQSREKAMWLPPALYPNALPLALFRLAQM